MKRIDLHMHTTHSDGSYAPRDLIRYAKQKKLDCISVTDHDTMSSASECRDEAKKQGLEYIPGIELSAKFSARGGSAFGGEPGTLHILGYFVNPENSGLQKKLSEVQKAREERNPKIIGKLRELGIDISLEDVLREAYWKETIPPGKQLGRPHFARTLVKKKVVTSMEEAFSRFLAKGQPAYVDKHRLTSREAISMIHEAGGVASVAHPKQMRLEGQELNREIKRLAEDGLDGIEVYHSSQGPDEREIYLKLAAQFNLVITGGSDFHGLNKPNLDLGYLGAGVELRGDTVAALRDRIGKNPSS